MPSRIGKQAVVVGAGIGGLTAARVVADYFERVVVLERDALPERVEPRAGVPQGRHIHGLLAGGQRALDDLFPGFMHDLVQTGAVPLRVGLDLRIESPGYDPFPQRDLGLGCLCPVPGSVGAESTTTAARLRQYRVASTMPRPGMPGTCGRHSGNRGAVYTGRWQE